MSAPRHARRSAAHRGVTLLELMMVLALIAILSAVALPTYHDAVRRSHRADARSALLQAAHWMERVATAQGVYPVAGAGSSGSGDALPPALRTVPSGRYALSLRVSTASAYTLAAEPLGAQSGDRCGTLTLDQAGVRDVIPTGSGASAELVASCWGR